MKIKLLPIVALVFVFGMTATAYSGSIQWFDANEYGIGQLCNETNNIDGLFADHDECVAAFGRDNDVIACKDAVETNDYVIVELISLAQWSPQGWSCPEGGTVTPLLGFQFCAVRLYPETVGECVSALRH